MHIIVIESDFFQREWLVKDLRKTFPTTTVTEFKTAGDFLLALNTLPVYGLIITEHFLALGEPRRDHEEWFGNLNSLFPEVTKNWNHQEAAERLIRHMRKTGIDVSVIIYTHSDKDFVDADILRDPKVTYCIKVADTKNLLASVRQSLAVSTT